MRRQSLLQVIGTHNSYHRDFVAELPSGDPARCNPVNAPRGRRDDRLEAGR